MSVPFWRSLVNEEQCLVRDPLADSERFHTVVIGAGLTGSSCALRLVQEPSETPSVLVLDARRLCDGATGRNGGHQFRALVRSNEIKAEIERKDVQRVRSLIKEHNWDVELDITGGIELFRDPSEAINVVKSTAEEEKATLLNQEQLKSQFGVSFESGVEFSDAAQIVPGKLVLNLVEKARELGAKFVSRAKVLGLEHHVLDEYPFKLQVELEGNPPMSIFAKNVVHATNGYGIELLPKDIVASSSLRAIKGQCIAARPSKPLINHSLGFDFNESSCGEYLIQRTSDRVTVFGGFRHVAENKGVDDTSDKAEFRVTEGLIGALENMFGRSKEELNVGESWAGAMCFTKDGDPIVGEHRKGEFYAVGFGGHGMVRAFSCGVHVAERIRNIPHSIPEITEAFSINRFKSA